LAVVLPEGLVEASIARHSVSVNLGGRQSRKGTPFRNVGWVLSSEDVRNIPRRLLDSGKTHCSRNAPPVAKHRIQGRSAIRSKFDLLI
jgi:hypothetical protein